MTDLRTIPDAAAEMYVSRATLYREIKRGRIKVVAIRGRRFVRLAEIERYLRAQERAA